MDADQPKIKVIGLPNLSRFIPLFLFSLTLSAAFVVYQNKESWAFGNIFRKEAAEAQSQLGDWNKIGVSSAVPVTALNAAQVRNIAALTGPGGSVLGIVNAADAGWAGAAKAFVDEASKYCLTPVLRLEAKNVPTPESWGDFFATVGDNGGKLVVHVGNEVNFKFEWPGTPSEFGDYYVRAHNAIKNSAPNAKVMGPPLNTSAPCPGNEEYICWQDFVTGMGGQAWSKMDGHASNAYPIAPDGPGAEGSYNIFGWEKDFINGVAPGYSGKDVYITETGLQSGWTGAWPTNNDFVSAVMSRWNSNGQVVMVNYFNAAGNNPDPRWVSEHPEFVFDGSEVEGWDGNGAVSNTSAKFSKNDTCEVVPRSEYRPMSAATPGEERECVGDMRTTLCPSDIKILPIPSEAHFKNSYEAGSGLNQIGMVTIMDVKGLTTANWGGTLDDNGTFSNPQRSFASIIERDFNSLVTYRLRDNVVADGRYFVNSANGVSTQKGIETSGVTDDEGLANYDQQDVKYYGTVQEGYFEIGGLGTMLGAVPINPYNYLDRHQLFDDFIVEPTPFELPFEEQQPEPGHIVSVLLRLLATLFDVLGLEGLLTSSAYIAPEDVQCTEAGDLFYENLHYYNKSDRGSGEKGLIVGDYLTEPQQCKPFEDALPGLRSALDACVAAHFPVPLPTPINPNPIYTPPDESDIKGACPDEYDEVKDTENALSDCMSEARPTKIRGLVSLSMPFLPILKETYLSYQIPTGGDLICDTEELSIDELTAADLEVEFKFYDKNACYEGLDAGACGTQGGHLTNGSFEEPGGNNISKVYDKGAIYTDFGGVISAPVGWTSWHQRSQSADVPCWGFDSSIAEAYCRIPEIKRSDLPFRQRIGGGNLSTQVFMNYGTTNAGLFQAVNFAGNPGNVTFNASAMMWSVAKEGWKGDSDKGGACHSDSAQNFHARIGIMKGHPETADVFILDDSNGDWHTTNFNYPGVEIKWSDVATTLDKFNDLSVTWSNASAGTYTFILQSRNLYANNNNDTYWDSACVTTSNDVSSSNATYPKWSGLGLESPLHDPDLSSLPTDRYSSEAILATYKEEFGKKAESDIGARYYLDFIEKYEDDLGCGIAFEDPIESLKQDLGMVMLASNGQDNGEVLGEVLGDATDTTCTLTEPESLDCDLPADANAQESGCPNKSAALRATQTMNFKAPGLGYLPYVLGALETRWKSPDNEPADPELRCKSQGKTIGDLGWYLIDKLSESEAWTFARMLGLEWYEFQGLRGFEHSDYGKLHCTPSDMFTISNQTDGYESELVRQRVGGDELKRRVENYAYEKMAGACRDKDKLQNWR